MGLLWKLWLNWCKVLIIPSSCSINGSCRKHDLKKKKVIIIVVETEKWFTKPTPFILLDTELDDISQAPSLADCVPMCPSSSQCNKGRRITCCSGLENLLMWSALFFFMFCWLVGVPQVDLGNHVSMMARPSSGSLEVGQSFTPFCRTAGLQQSK